MPTPPYARLAVRVNAGAQQFGGITAAHGDAIRLEAESTAYWGSPAAEWTIYDYPDGWTGPGAPWVTISVPQPNGLPDADVFKYYGNSFPPSFNLPALPYWGKFEFSLLVNGGSITSTLYDEATAVQVLSPNGLMIPAFRETKQFGAWRGFSGPLIDALRVIDGFLSTVPAVGSSVGPTANKIALRGASAESGFGRLYSAGTVHTTAWLSYSRNGIILGCKTGGGVDHAIITEDGAAGFVYGDATSTTRHTFKADGVDALVLNPGGTTTIGTSASGSIDILANSGEVITFDVGGDSYSFDEMGFSIPAGNTLQIGGVSMTSSATNSAPMTRDSSGRTQVSDPSVDADVATKGYVDGADRNSATEPTVIVASDRYVYVDGTVVNNITLPTATTFNGINLTLINTSDSIGDDITITSNGGQIIGIGGSAAIPLGFGYTMTLRGRASDWIIISTGTV